MFELLRFLTYFPAHAHIRLQEAELPVKDQQAPQNSLCAWREYELWR